MGATSCLHTCIVYVAYWVSRVQQRPLRTASQVECNEGAPPGVKWGIERNGNKTSELVYLVR